MGVIRILPPEVVNRIAAGEVVERPASVVKELVENSLDAGATEVDIHVEEGGKRLIRLRDNGCGMEPEDLPLAFATHATSKLQDWHMESNLMGVASLGFRGEALASIASVSMASVTSRTARAPHAWSYRPGEREPVPAAGEPGTTVEVRNLFHNVPARRKFQRTNATELSHVVQQFVRIALAFPGVRFSLTHGEKTLFRLAPVDSLRERLGQILGDEAVAALVEVRREAAAAGAPTICGFVGDPRLHRKDARDQHLFVNGRCVRDRLLSHALRAAFQGFLIPGIQPVAYLFLEVSPADVDVNVHPTKAEVRFRDSSEVYRLLQSAVRAALEGRPSTLWTSPDVGEAHGTAPPDRTVPDAALSETSRLETAVRDFLARPSGALPARWGHEHAGTPRRPPAGEIRSGSLPAPGKRGSGLAAQTSDPSISSEGAGGERPLVALPEAPLRASQVLRTYILIEAPDGVALIDQHAFHEKILFEQIHARLREGRLESQRLLVPEVVDVSPEHLPLLERAASLLEPLGFEIKPFGSSSVAVHAFPSLFDKETGATDLPAIVRGVIESLLDDAAMSEDEPPAPPAPASDSGSLPEGAAASFGDVPPAFRDALWRIASAIACRRAVKAGTPLGQEEIRMLLERGTLAQDPRNCPHGRPTAVFLSRRDIEKRFDRK